MKKFTIIETDENKLTSHIAEKDVCSMTANGAVERHLMKSLGLDSADEAAEARRQLADGGTLYTVLV